MNKRNVMMQMSSRCEATSLLGIYSLIYNGKSLIPIWKIDSSKIYEKYYTNKHDISTDATNARKFLFRNLADEFQTL